MEIIPENSIMRLPPGALNDIRKIHSMDKPGIVEQGLNILEAWILKQNHIIKKDFSREYLEKTLGSCKGSVEKTKKQIDRLCTMKTLMPKFFSKTNVKTELQNILKLGVMPDVTDDFYRIVILRITDKFFTSDILMQYYQYAIVLAEYVKANDYINGYILIYDLREMNLFDFISKVNTVELQQFLTILVEGYGARLQSLHMLTESKTIEIIINIVKQFVSEKIGNRMQVQRSLEDLHKAVPIELLPVEYGGKQKSFDIMCADLFQELSSEKHVEYVKMMFKACTDETKRHSGDFNEEYMGMPGSFRCLSVD